MYVRILLSQGARDQHNFPADVTLRDYCERMRATNARLDATLAHFKAGRRAVAEVLERSGGGGSSAV